MKLEVLAILSCILIHAQCDVVLLFASLACFPPPCPVFQVLQPSSSLLQGQKTTSNDSHSMSSCSQVPRTPLDVLSFQPPPPPCRQQALGSTGIYLACWMPSMDVLPGTAQSQPNSFPCYSRGDELPQHRSKLPEAPVSSFPGCFCSQSFIHCLYSFFSPLQHPSHLLRGCSKARSFTPEPDPACSLS